MRVMHVAECNGGVDRFLKSFLKYSTCENILILSQLYNKEEYEVYSNNVESMYMSHDIDISALKEVIILRKKIKKYKPDVVCAHSSIAGAITRMAAIGLNVKVIYNPHGWSFNMKSKRKKVFILLERIMAFLCDAIVCVSEAEKESALREKICNEDKLHVIYNGIDISKNFEEKINLSIPKNSFVIGMVGRICDQKAPDIFVNMAAEIQKEIDNAYFVIVGDAINEEKEERIKIEKLANKLGVRLLITGWVNNPLAYMQNFNIGCLLSRWEGFGLVISEYMLMNVPVVATNVDAIPYLIQDGINGKLVDVDNWKMAAKAVIELAKNSDERKKLVENGKKIVCERFDVRRVSREYEELYMEVLK